MPNEQQTTGDVNISGISDSDIDVGPIVTGQVEGDAVGGDKIAGDKVLGDKIVYEAPPPPLPPAEARERRDLGILLKNVETTWIKGVLEKSVYDVVLLDLDKESRADAVDHPWQTVLETPDEVRQVLPRDKNIKDIFDEANHLLLILGEPGSGKTTTLLQLARDLMAELKQDPTFTQAVPVVFNLSTWTGRQQPLDEWLITELASKYRTPKKLGRRWLEERRILPLLDGLDEVKLDNRAACVEEINRLSVDYGLQGMVVCSRIKDYTVLDVRLQFNSAIYLQPLTSEQIDEYFERAGDKLASLRSTLQRDETLHSLAQSPLMLNIMSLAYQDVQVLSSQTFDSVEARRRHLFDTYIKQMFKRRGKADKSYDDHQTTAWLVWLAQKMTDHNQTIFLIEQLQPEWLKTKIQVWTYTLADRMIVVLFLAAASLAFVDFTPISLWLIIGVMAGLAGGQPSIFSSRKNWSSIYHIVGGGLIIGVLGALDYWLGNTRVIDIIGVNALLFDSIIAGLSWALLGGFYFALVGGPSIRPRSIITVETLHWSGSQVIRLQSILGLAAVVVIALAIGLLTADIESGLSLAVLAVLTGAFVIGLVGGQAPVKITPNQGIRLSARNAIISGLGFGLIFTLTYIFFFLGADSVLRDVQSGHQGSILALLGWLSIGLFIGVGGALFYGGYACISHLTLRIILSTNNILPWNLADFLDFATERIFLQKVGGGYIFIHRLLLEHFAAMETSDSNE
jgi:DNA polymerase III delta prime subunit